MRNFADETMIYQNTNSIKRFWKKLQLRSFSLLSSSNAFIACQYFTVRGLRTLNGKMVQHHLAQYYLKHPDQDNAPIPAKVSYHHFCDESYHFNSSTIIGHDVIKSLNAPSAFERKLANMALEGTQKDHAYFNVSVNGIFWYEPALFSAIYKILRTSHFGMDHTEALLMMNSCFTEENEGIHLSHLMHQEAQKSYQQYLEGLDYVNKVNREMKYMDGMTPEKYIRINRWHMKKFEGAQSVSM